MAEHRRPGKYPVEFRERCGWSLRPSGVAVRIRSERPVGGGSPESGSRPAGRDPLAGHPRSAARDPTRRVPGPGPRRLSVDRHVLSCRSGRRLSSPGPR